MTPFFRKTSNFNKMLKSEYPECECYIDYDEMKDDFMASPYSFSALEVLVEYKTRNSDSYEKMNTQLVKMEGMYLL